MKWAYAPTDVLIKVSESLNCQELQTVRLVCKGWKEAFSEGVTRLSPKMQANSLGLQWNQLAKMQLAFPMVQELDLQQCPPSAGDAHYFGALSSLKTIKISSILRTENPEALMKEVHEFALGVQLSNPSVVIELDLRLAMTSSDQQTKVCQSMTQLPPNIAITNLNMPQQCGVSSTSCLHMLLSLETLRSLHLVQYGSIRVGDDDFSRIAGLKHLQSLSFGLITHVQDSAIIAGLQNLCQLRHLALFDVSSITDKCIQALTPKLVALQFLSLSKCCGLTNTGMDSLASMPALNKLFLTENDQITNNTAQKFRTGLRVLHVRHCPNIHQYDIIV